jgi:hypothetical protein
VRCRQDVPWDAVAFLGIAILATLALTYFYGIITMGGALRYRAFIPVARYIYPVVVPVAWILVSGWQEIPNWLRRVKPIPAETGALVFISFFVLVDLYAWCSLILAYYPTR